MNYGVTPSSPNAEAISMMTPSERAKQASYTGIKSVTTPSINPVSQKVQVGKLVSDFKVGMGSSAGDRKKYYNNINYDSLSPNAKVVADRIFDSKKKDEEDKIIPTKVVTVVRSVPNANGTVTNYLSDGTTSIVRETPTGKTTA